MKKHKKLKKLLLSAHPNPKGFAHRILERFDETSKKQGHETRIIDLYDSQYTQSFLQLTEKNRYEDNEKRDTMQKHIARADEIVFAYPIWWFDVPAILKNRFDQNFTQWFAFNYRKGKLLPEKLLIWKTSRVFLTWWGASWMLKTVGLTMWFTMVQWRLWYVGIKNKSRTVFGDMNTKRSEEEREKMLQKVEKIARK